MAKIGVGKVMNVGGSTAIRLPSVITRDKAFCFVEGQEVIVEIKDKKLVVYKE